MHLPSRLRGFWVARIDGWDYVEVLEEGLDLTGMYVSIVVKCDGCMCDKTEFPTIGF